MGVEVFAEEIQRVSGVQVPNVAQPQVEAVVSVGGVVAGFLERIGQGIAEIIAGVIALNLAKVE